MAAGEVFFSATVGDWSAAFEEVSGLSDESQEIEFRHGDSKFLHGKLPGIEKEHTVTLTKGVFASADKFWDWNSAVVGGTVKRETVTLELLDETGGVLYAWTLKKAYPVKLSVGDLKSEGNEVAVERLEIMCEEIEMVVK